MREIKFRAFDRQEKKMILVHGLTFPEKPAFLGALVDGDNEEPWIGRFEVMQFTGLRDKNGKEIYEGDLLRWPHYKHSRTGKVVWGKCGFWIEGFLDVLNMRTNELEVIGNIYEGEK